MNIETRFTEALKSGLIPHNEFNSKAYAYLLKRGEFSPGYARCLAAAIDKAENGPDIEDLGDFSAVIDLFDTAKENLKWPKIRLSAGDNPLVLGVAGPRAKFPGTINVTDGGPYGANIWYGRIDRDGNFEKARSATFEVVAVLKALANDPAHTAEVYGKRFNECCFCARELTDDRSVNAGYGPTCAENFGLKEDWKIAAKEAA